MKEVKKIRRARTSVHSVHPVHPVHYPVNPERINPLDGIVMEPTALAPLNCVYRDDPHGIFLYQGDCLEVLDAIAAKHPDGCFDMIFADPPYFLSNGGITCHAGKMVKVHKGDWDSLAKSFGASKSEGAMQMMHEFNTEWLKRCQRVLKPNGTIWVTGTHHVIFSVGYAMQQLGFKILNDIAWEKPNPPPNLSCRYFTHSTETILWAAKTEKSKHLFNYKAMKAVTGKQMKTVWTMSAPGKPEKTFGKHPTQKPIALVERCIHAATNAGDLILDPFLGGGTTAVACARSYRLFVGIELDYHHIELAAKRTDREIVEIWLREFRVRMNVILIVGRDAPGYPAEPVLVGRPARLPSLFPDEKNDPNDLDPNSGSMDRIREMADVPEIQTESIFHETKFVFLSCAQPRTGSVVHTTVDADVQPVTATSSLLQCLIHI